MLKREGASEGLIARLSRARPGSSGSKSSSGSDYSCHAGHCGRRLRQCEWVQRKTNTHFMLRNYIEMTCSDNCERSESDVELCSEQLLSRSSSGHTRGKGGRLLFAAVAALPACLIAFDLT